MIESGLGWKFRDHISDRILFEDQVCEHMVSGHLARRRVFPERLYKDEIALGLIKEQIALSAKIEHPGFQRYFLAGDSVGHFTIVGELYDAPPLTIAAERKVYARAKDWHAFATRFVRFCLDMQRLRIALDRLNLDDVQFHRNMFQIASRFPVGVVDAAAITGSPYLQRLMESGVGGAYVVDKGDYPSEASLRRVKEFLFTLASGQATRTVQQAIELRQESARTTGAKQFSSLGIDLLVEGIILRMHDSHDPQPIRSFAALAAALDAIPPEDLARSGQAVQTGVPPSSGNVGGSSPHVPARGAGAPPSSSGPSGTFASSTAPRPAAGISMPGTASPAPPKSAPRVYDGPTGRTDHKVADRDTRMKEDETEDRSYLYPQRSTSPAAAPKPASASASAPKPDPQTGGRLPSGTLYGSHGGAVPKAKGKTDLTGLLKVVGVLALLAALAGGGWFVWSMTQAPPPNGIPVAAIATTPATIEVLQTITLDAGPSTDPDGEPLVYTWRVKDVDKQTYLGTPDHKLLPNGTKEAAKPTLQIFQAGRYEIELKVFDGRSNSEPVHRPLEVVPKKDSAGN